MKIKFNIPTVTRGEERYLMQVIQGKSFCGDRNFSKKCEALIEDITGAKKALMTSSATHALEVCALLTDLKEGDEVIMPSYTFVSTANAFVLRGAKIRFVDIDPVSMNIDETLIEAAVSEKTKAIVVVHYAGVSCNMKEICEISNKYNLMLIEDAAQALDAYLCDKHLGTFGDLACFSFHETKNYQCGEGGALLINNEELLEKAEIIREKGTNRSRFIRGQVDKYSWVDVGSSYLMSEFQAAFLLAQLESVKQVTARRLKLWSLYHSLLSQVEGVACPQISSDKVHNAHIYFLKLETEEIRDKLMHHLHGKGVQSVFHYVPLHSSKAGKLYSVFEGTDRWTTLESSRLLRMPLHNELTESDLQKICKLVISFLGQIYG